MITEDGKYIAPDPTPEQEAQAKRLKEDPNNLGGVDSPAFPLWDLSNDDFFAAAFLLHDLSYEEGGPHERQKQVDDDCLDDMDALIAALPIDHKLKRIWERTRREGAEGLIALGGNSLWHEDNHNDATTQAQADAQKAEAQYYINLQCLKAGISLRYPGAKYAS